MLLIGEEAVNARMEGRSVPDISATSSLPEKLTWSVRPCTMDRKRCMGVVAVILLFGIGVVLVLDDLFLGVLSVVVLLGSLHSYFFKASYSLSAESVEIKSPFGTQKREWKSFKTFWVDSKGLSLSPFAKRSWLEHYRGMRLLFAENKDEVVGFVTEVMGKESRRGQRGTPVF